MKLPRGTRIPIAVLLSVVCLTGLWADEGMWIFNNLPRQYLKEKYGFELSEDWAEHLMRSSVRFNSGGSGSFVSSDGLTLTNHHIASNVLHKVSTPENNYYRDGFLARSREQEIRAPDLELNVLISIEDVTDRVNQAAEPGVSSGQAFSARQAVMSRIEQESLEKTDLRSDVVTLYRGGQYHLYRYKKYTDVRLVWAPEAAVGLFGGDPDNFEYPRYCLDAALFRVYEDGKPAPIEHFLKWSRSGPGEGELVFVSGNPGRTSRLYTTHALKTLRDIRLPYSLRFLRRLEIMLQQFGSEGEEETRRARDELLSVQNSRKAYMGMLRGLQDPALLKSKTAAQMSLRGRVEADAKLRQYAGAWDRIAEAQSVYKEIMHERALFELGWAFRSQLFSIARNLVRMAEEDQKPNAERLRQYRESARSSLEQRLFSAAPVYADLEQAKLGDSLGFLAEQMGGDDPLVREVLAGKNPASRAAELVQESKLHDVEVRRKLAQGGSAAIADSDDPMIRLALLVDGRARQVRKRYEEQVAGVEQQAYAQIADAIFAIQGTSVYPDATFTLRLSFGSVKAYPEGGRTVPAWTTMGGAFDHEEAHGGKEPWRLPDSWRQRRNAMKLETPMNFVSTADIIGGNSGSPVVNVQGELVGLIFDGNTHSLTADYMYSDTQGRAISVHSSAIREAISSIYQAPELAEELGR